MRERDQPRLELGDGAAVTIKGTIVGIVDSWVFVQPEGLDCAIRAPLERAPKVAIGVVRALEVEPSHPPTFRRWAGQPEEDPFMAMPPPGPRGLPPPGQPLPLDPANGAALKRVVKGVLGPDKVSAETCDALLYLVRRAHGQGASKRP